MKHRRNSVLASPVFVAIVIVLKMLQYPFVGGSASTDEHSREELLIRGIYMKLSLHNAAANKDESDVKLRKYEPDNDIKFEIRNVHTGSIAEILENKLYDLTTFPSGDIIRITRNTITFNGKDEEFVGYSARLEVGQYTTAVVPRSISIKEAMSSLGSKYADVGKYSTYEVTVRLGKISRGYKAMALYHSPYQSTSNPEPEFWDWIVGAGGILNDLWSERRPLIGSQKIVKLKDVNGSEKNRDQVDLTPDRSPDGKVRTVFDCSDDQPICCSRSAASISQCCWNSKYSYTNPGIVPTCKGPGGTPKDEQSLVSRPPTTDTKLKVAGATTSCPENVRSSPRYSWFDSGTLDHVTGYHSYQVDLQGICRQYSDCSTSCRVSTLLANYYESPFFISVYYFLHYGKEDVKDERASGYGSDSIV